MRAHDDPLVGDADAHALVEALVLAEQRPQGVGQRLDVGDLAVADDAGPRAARSPRGRWTMRAVDRDLTRP